jgi:hypothetical protein
MALQGILDEDDFYEIGPGELCRQCLHRLLLFKGVTTPASIEGHIIFARKDRIGLKYLTDSELVAGYFIMRILIKSLSIYSR